MREEFALTLQQLQITSTVVIEPRSSPYYYRQHILRPWKAALRLC